jgi:hypothetical protein
MSNEGLRIPWSNYSSLANTDLTVGSSITEKVFINFLLVAITIEYQPNPKYLTIWTATLHETLILDLHWMEQANMFML